MAMASTNSTSDERPLRPVPTLHISLCAEWVAQRDA
jgi:hypothetical protein